MAYVDSPFVKILTGVRRCGKSTMLKMIIEELKKTNLAKDYKTNVRFMSMGNLKKDRKRVETSYGIRVIPVPFLENPFQVSSHDFGFFEQIWKGKQLSH